jgi:serine protease inhibitor
MATSPGPDQSEVVELNFDRPFLYVIRETSTGTILFMGMVTGF